VRSLRSDSSPECRRSPGRSSPPLRWGSVRSGCRCSTGTGATWSLAVIRTSTKPSYPPRPSGQQPPSLRSLPRPTRPPRRHHPGHGPHDHRRRRDVGALLPALLFTRPPCRVLIAVGALHPTTGNGRRSTSKGVSPGSQSSTVPKAVAAHVRAWRYIDLLSLDHYLLHRKPGAFPGAAMEVVEVQTTLWCFSTSTGPRSDVSV